MLKPKSPPKFAVKDHLFYKGNTPTMDYFDDITPEEYEGMVVSYWSFHDETISYKFSFILYIQHNKNCIIKLMQINCK